jgi:hypothetical protein
MNYIHVIHPAGQLSAVRKCFLHFLALDTFFWRSKRKYLAKGETLLTEFQQIGGQAVTKKKIGRSSFPAPGQNTRASRATTGFGRPI